MVIMATPQSGRYESRISSFNDTEFGGQSEEAAESTSIEEDVLESFVESEEEEALSDPELMDVDLRLETADYYRGILNHDFFNTDSNAAQIVDREIRSFIRERLEILLGLRAPRQEAQASESAFSDHQVEALKAVADAVIAKKGPIVKKMPAPVPAKPEPKQVLRPRPQMKKIPLPPPAPSTKPKPKARPAPVQVKKTVQEPEAESEPKPAQKLVAGSSSIVVHEPGLEGGIEQSYIDREGRKHTLIEGSIIEEGGRRFKVEANGAGTLFRKDITGQVAPRNRLAPMTPQQISIYSQQQAEQQLNMLDDTTGMAVVASLSRQ